MIRRAAVLAAMVVSGPVAAQPTELIARIEGSGGSITVTARGDARVTVAGLRLMPLEVVAGDFALGPLGEWRAAVSHADTATGPEGSERFVASLAGDIMLSLTGGDEPIVRLRRGSDGAAVGLLLDRGWRDSLAVAVERAIIRARELTQGYAPSLLSAAPAELLRGPTARDTVRADTAGGKTPRLRAVDRIYVSAAGGLIGAAAIGMISDYADVCLGGSPCPWTEGNIGFVVGSIAGSVFAARYLGGPGACPEKRTRLAFEAAFVGAFPPGLVVAAGQRKGIFFIPVGQALTLWWLERECAKGRSGR